jgi:hypothetical protein
MLRTPTRRRAAATVAALALVLPAGADAAREPSHAIGQWAPGPLDTCPAPLHDSYSVVGPDGKLYPTWHPPRVVDPATGERCGFGHEHGRDPEGSDIAGWVARHLAAPGAGRRSGIPFGLAAESLDAYAAANPGTPTRHEDHVGHKVEWQNDVELERLHGSGPERLGVSCDFLTKIHQGTHSPDAFGNNVHELLYAVRCDDGTRLIADKLVTFGEPNGFVRACDKETPVAAGTGHSYPAGGGVRLIPDRACVDEHVLVADGEYSLYSRGLYEDWMSANYLRTPGGRRLAYFDPHFAVFNPSRFAGASTGSLERTIGVCWEQGPGGERARGGPCDQATGSGTVTAPLPYDDPDSPFDGAAREVYFNQTTIENGDGPRHWWTDPYGGNASRDPFPGAICQLVGKVDNTGRPTLESQAFGAGRDYGGHGVHSPN